MIFFGGIGKNGSTVAVRLKTFQVGKCLRNAVEDLNRVEKKCDKNFVLLNIWRKFIYVSSIER